MKKFKEIDDYTPENVEGLNEFESIAILYALAMTFIIMIGIIASLIL